LRLQNWISTPKRKNDDFEALFKRDFKRKIIFAKMQKNLLPKHHSQPSCSHYNTIYDSAAKDINITHAAAATKNLGTTIPLASANIELRSNKELCTTAAQIAAPKPDLDAQKRRF
jgi:hypothetical protein